MHIWSKCGACYGQKGLFKHRTFEEDKTNKRFGVGLLLGFWSCCIKRCLEPTVFHSTLHHIGTFANIKPLLCSGLTRTSTFWSYHAVLKHSQSKCDPAGQSLPFFPSFIQLLLETQADWYFFFSYKDGFACVPVSCRSGSTLEWVAQMSESASCPLRMF